MSDWIHSLAVRWMALVVFGFTYLLAATIFAAVTALATGERAKSFKAVSPGTLPASLLTSPQRALVSGAMAGFGELVQEMTKVVSSCLATARCFDG